ncbi:MAG TPA: glycosyl hydrolase family 18 protein [Saprospiraceae bacterium]|nr:glycosyl hydrolase family 18 protein [Saprospiraceae bacterium]
MKFWYINILFFVFTGIRLMGQNPDPALIGYWHNWNDPNAPYIEIDEVDSRYNVINVAFAVPQSGTDYLMEFIPESVSQLEFINQVQLLQGLGKKVVISIGGATAPVSLDNVTERDAFVNSVNSIIATYGFDGIDIDFEGSSLTVSGGTIASPVDVKIIHLIDAIRQIMSDYYSANGKKLFLSMAPETAFVQGGMAAYGSIWGAYLPVIDALRDSLEVLHVQLYNSGSMYGIDGNIYSQGTADFIVSMTEAVIQGFNTSGGMFNGLSPQKVAVALPACPNAAGGGYMDPGELKAALDYLRGLGTQPGTYELEQFGGYPDLRGLMTWSINWDAVSSCGSSYEFANSFENNFGNSGAYSLKFLASGSDSTPDIDRVKIPLDAPARPIDVGGNFTIEFWMKAQPGDNTAQECQPSSWYFGNVVIDRDVFNDGDYGDYGIVICDRRIVVGVQRGNLAHGGVVGNTIVDDGSWHHIAVTRNSVTGGVALYVDGILDAISNSSHSDQDISYRDGRSTGYPDDPTLVFGAEKHDYPGSLYFKGKLDEFRLSNNIRYTTNFTVPAKPMKTDANTVGLYHFDEGSGLVLNDFSGATGGPSHGNILYGGTTVGPQWSYDNPFQNYLEVTTTNNSGTGSLRQVITDASPGSIIVFAPHLNDQTIYLNTPIPINKALIIMDLNANKINIQASGTGPVFNIGSTGRVVLKSFNVISGTGTSGRMLNNQGNVVLRDVELTDINPGSGNCILNTGTVQFQGNTYILD